MSLIINNDTTIEESFDDKYNLDINECIINIRIYCRNNNLPFLNNFKINGQNSFKFYHSLEGQI